MSKATAKTTKPRNRKKRAVYDVRVLKVGNEECVVVRPAYLRKFKVF